MLGIALLELTRRAQEQVFAHKVRLCVNERHHVLQLVAEPKGSARLIVAAAPPKPTG